MRVLQPVIDRTYDPNPQGSATTTVTMAAAMPFSRTVRVARYGSQPAGMSGLGDATSDANAQMAADAAAYTAAQSAVQAVPKSDTSTLWGQLAEGLTRAGSTIVQGAATRVANRLTGTSATTLPRTYMPGASGPSFLLIGGVAAVAGLGLWFMMRKPAHASRRRR